MENFVKYDSINDGIRDALLREVADKTDLWNGNTGRTYGDQSPFQDVSDIWLRYNGDFSSIDRVINDLEMVNYPGWDLLPSAREIVYGLLYSLKANRIGRVLITKLPPGKVITPHVDQGANAAYYSRFQIALSCDPQSPPKFYCGNEMAQMLPGEIWYFNNRKEHWVENDSTVDRVSMIVDLRP